MHLGTHGLMLKLKEKGSHLNRAPVITATLLVAAFYITFTLVALALHGWNPMWFVWIGERYAELDSAGRTGYDGQFVYYIANYGADGVAHLDNPVYRLQRILLPVIVRLASCGVTSLVPWALISVNLAAIVTSTYLLAKWLDDQSLSPWYALMASMYVGVFLAYTRDLTEPLALCLAASGARLWLKGKPARSVVLLALAALTKETSLVFAFGLLLAALTRRDFRSALWTSVAVMPLLAWEIYLSVALGAFPFASGPSLERVPLMGIAPHLTLDAGRLSAFLFAGLPGLVLLWVASGFLWRQRGQSPVAWWVFLNGLFVVLMPLDVYNHIMHAGRNASGLMMSLVFLLPLIDKRHRVLLMGYLVVPTAVWLVPALRWAPWLSAS